MFTVFFSLITVTVSKFYFILKKYPTISYNLKLKQKKSQWTNFMTINILLSIIST